MRVAGIMVLLSLLVLNSCDHGLDPRPPGPTGIAGRLNFVGEWTSEVGEVAVVVYRHIPQQLADFFALAGADTNVELATQYYDYFVSVEGAGTYAWIVVAWRPPDRSWNFRSLLGCYHVAGDTFPASVEVYHGQITAGVDIQIDLGALNSETPPDLCVDSIPDELLDQSRGD